MTFVEPTELRLNPDYQYYYFSWTRAILLAIVPFLLLLILNSKIIFQLRKSENLSSSRVSLKINKNDRWNLNDPFYSQPSSQQKKEAKLARILILIVFFFLFCNMCKVALTIFDLGSLDNLRICLDNNLQFKSPLWVTIMVSLNHMFLVMNASANIFLFMVTGTQVNIIKE